MLEANIDDTHAEYLGSNFQDQLLAVGAKDFFLTAVHMKKGRPGLMLSVLTTEDYLSRVSDFILENTSTIGLRYYPVARHELKRKLFEIETKYGKVKVKEVTTPSGQKRFKIEYDSLWELSQKHQMSLQQLQMELYGEMVARRGD